MGSGIASVTLRYGVWWTRPSHLSVQAAQWNRRRTAAATSPRAASASPVMDAMRAAKSAARASRFSAT
jgi:hypothetical protein